MPQSAFQTRYRCPLCVVPIGCGWVALLGLIGAGCAAAAAPVPVAAPTVVAADDTAPARLPLQAMTLRSASAEEQALATQLRQDVEALLATGQRNTSNEWALAEATDHLAEQLEKLGLSVRREGFAAPDGALAQNLVVDLPGGDLGQEVVLVGARFDSVPGSAGADDNASGVAALLALARHVAGTAHRRGLRLVWFSDASSRQVAELMGAWHHTELGAKPHQPADEGQPATRLAACIELHGLGVYSDQAGSQRYAAGMPAGHPIAEFIEVESVPQYRSLSDLFSHAMGTHSTVPVKVVTTLEPDPADGMTAFRAFVEHGCPALLVHDTHQLRYPEFGTPGDTIEHLDFNRLARAVAGLFYGVAALTDPQPGVIEPAGPLGSMPGSLTPQHEGEQSDHPGQ